MRKDFSRYKWLKGVRVTYEVSGLNQDRLLLALKKRGILMYDVKKFNNKRMWISVNLNQSKNFFAITKYLCYNTKKIGINGKGTTFYSLLKIFGLVIGAVAFTIISLVASDLVLKIEFKGSGQMYAKEIRAYLRENNVTELSRFSDIDIKTLEDKILADNEHLTFVSAKQNGNSLEIYSVVKTEKPTTLGGNCSCLKTPISGVVESLKVYRGNPTKIVGQRVEVGDILVDGNVLVKDQQLLVNVLAYATVIGQETYEHVSKLDGQEQIATAFAESLLDAKNVIVTKQKVGEDYVYTVVTEYRCVIYAN